MPRAPSAYTVWVRCYRRHIDEDYEPSNAPQLQKLCRLLKDACDGNMELMEAVCNVALDNDFLRDKTPSPAYVTRNIKEFRRQVEREQRQWTTYIAPTGLGK